MNVCAILMLSMASIMCSVIGSVKTFFRPLSLSPPSEFIEEEEEKRAKNAKFFRFPADVFHMTLIRIIWLFFFGTFTVFENHRKSLIQYRERSELRLHFEWTKVN